MMFEHHTLLLIALLPCKDMLSREAAFLEIPVLQVIQSSYLVEV